MKKNKTLLLLTIFTLTALLLGACTSISSRTARILNRVENTPVQVKSRPAPTQEGNNPLVSLQDAYEQVYQQVSPSVVHIRVVKTVQGLQQSPSPFGNLPFNAPEFQPPQNFQQEGTGSGFVWDSKGHIITNNHVVEGAEQIEVTFADGTSMPAELVGADPDSDLAVIQVDTQPGRLHPMLIADSTQVRVGQIAIAIGNPFGLQESMTTGIISALGRSLPTQNGLPGGTYTIPDIIQTDAPINPGNSGGVLVDIDGALIGVTAAIESPVRANAGIGFVIPSIIVQNVVPDLISKGSYEHPWIGISGRTLPSDLAQAMSLEADQHGVLVVDVVPDSPAEKSGLQGSDRTATVGGQEERLGGDIITRIDDLPVNDFEDLTAYLARSTHVGQTVSLTLLRDGKIQKVDLTLGVRPTQPGPEGQGEVARAWLGVRVLPLTPELNAAIGLPEDQQGLLVQQVMQGSPADKAGLRGSFKTLTLNGKTILTGGDIISALDGNPLPDAEALRKEMANHLPGDVVALTVLRDGQELRLPVTLDPLP